MNEQFAQWSIACGGWLMAVLLAYFGYHQRRTNQQTEALLRTVAYFEGGTQKRSIGIALAEGLVGRNSRNRATLIPLLTNQFVYLLLNPDVTASVHEERNLIRVFNLLKDTPNLRENHSYSFSEVADAIGRRLYGRERSGLDVTSSTLKVWCETINISLAEEDYKA